MQKQKITCKNCNSTNIIKRGFARNKLQNLQKYQCKDCSSIFTTEQTKGKTYPMKIILQAISTYNLGYNLEQTAERINKKYNLTTTSKTISNWVNQHKNICVFARIRNKATKQFNPKNIIQKQTLNHIQPYTFKFHKAKLNLLLKQNPQFTKLKDYFEKINSKGFPHHIFTHHKENKNNQRASQIKISHLKIKCIKKQNLANTLTELALNLAKTNNQRHQAVQDFFLTNDSTTIAAEVPVYLTNWDAGYYRNQSGFIFPLKNYQTPITGHIDLLQIRNNLIHILDYKPNSKLNQEQTTKQLTIYALALSRKLSLELKHFKSAWFDENNYYEFYPLHAVYKKAG